MGSVVCVLLAKLLLHRYEIAIQQYICRLACASELYCQQEAPLAFSGSSLITAGHTSSMLRAPVFSSLQLEGQLEFEKCLRALPFLQVVIQKIRLL